VFPNSREETKAFLRMLPPWGAFGALGRTKGADMKRRFSILGIVAVMATSLWAAAPAQAAEVPHCEWLVRQQDIVQTGPGVVTIYPSNAGPYANHLTAGAQGYVTCVVNEVLGPLVTCAKTVVANRPTVTIDLYTLAITIDYSKLLGTTCSL
jgi:hypothetical protein